MKNDLTVTLATVALAVYMALLTRTVKPVWVVTMFSLGLTFGSLSTIVATRKLFFLSASSPHISLFTITLSVLITGRTDLVSVLLAILIGILVVDVTGLTIGKGFDKEATVGFVTGLSTSLTVLTLYLLISYRPIGFNVYSLMVGDPLLTTPLETVVTLIIAAITVASVTLTFREQILISFDPDLAKVSGLKTWFYDLIAYTLIGVNSIGLMKSTGYILQHVLLLIPPSIVLNLRADMWRSLLLSTLSTVYISILSLHLSVILNLPPTGVMGLIFLVYYLLILLRRR